MFRIQNWQQKLSYMAVGSVFTIIGMLFAIGLLSSVTAQRDKFGKIECTKLRVVDAEGNKQVILTFDEHGGYVAAYGKDGKSKAGLYNSEYGGLVGAYGKDGKSQAGLGIHEHGGGVITTNKYGKLKTLD